MRENGRFYQIKSFFQYELFNENGSEIASKRYYELNGQVASSA